ncbi:MAG: arsenate-mycothiol transferase ArsC [Candidatus Kariarchaeaceae archaeon]|jgi:protein-tyrosine-phosphatase
MIKELTRNAPTIYFVCSGNIIRSSFAELLARHRGLTNVASYGTTYHNSAIHTRSNDELLRLGVSTDLIRDFHPRHISDLSGFVDRDLHVVMTQDHKDQLEMRGIPPDQIVLITEFINRNDDVADPYFSGNYTEAYSTISQAVDQIITILS